MRLTNVLLKQPYKRLLNKQWKYRGFVVKNETSVPRVLEAQGVEIVDAAEYYFPTKKKEKWTPPVPDDPRFYLPELKDHVDYKETPILDFNWSTKLFEGEKQAYILTKTQPLQGLPQKITEKIGAVILPNQDDLAKRAILQSNVWDPTIERLPRRFNPKDPGWKFKPEKGIPKEKQVRLMLTNLLRIVRRLGGLYPDITESFMFHPDPYVSAQYDFEDKRIQIRGICGDWKSSTNRMLPPFVGDEIVKETESHELPDIFPVAPTIDLKHEHIWRPENITGWKEGASHPYPHTLYIPVRKRVTTTNRNTQSLMFAFAHTLATAKQLYGPEPQVLKKPIIMNVIKSDGVVFDFISFQLNTTDLTSSSGVKNLVWFDNDNYLYQKEEPVRSMLRLTEYHDYDPNVFAKFTAVSLHGADLSFTYNDIAKQQQLEESSVVDRNSEDIKV